MTNIDFGSTPIVLPNVDHVGTSLDVPQDAIEPFVGDAAVRRAISALRRAPIRLYRNNVIACEGDCADYLFLIVSGTVRACKTFQWYAKHRRVLSAGRLTWLV